MIIIIIKQWSSRETQQSTELLPMLARCPVQASSRQSPLTRQQEVNMNYSRLKYHRSAPCSRKNGSKCTMMCSHIVYRRELMLVHGYTWGDLSSIEETGESRRKRSTDGRQASDQYCCNNTAMADLQISFFRA